MILFFIKKTQERESERESVRESESVRVRGESEGRE